MRGKPGEVLNTTETNTQTLHLFLFHMYVRTATTAHLLLPYCSIWLRKCYTVLCLLPVSSKSCKWICEYTCILQYPVLKSIVQCTLLSMHSTVFFQRKTLYINCVHNRIFPKKFFLGGGGQMHYWPPVLSLGGRGPPGPPVADPWLHYSLLCTILIYNWFIQSANWFIKFNGHILRLRMNVSVCIIFVK